MKMTRRSVATDAAPPTDAAAVTGEDGDDDNETDAYRSAEDKEFWANLAR